MTDPQQVVIGTSSTTAECSYMLGRQKSAHNQLGIQFSPLELRTFTNVEQDYRNCEFC